MKKVKSTFQVIENKIVYLNDNLDTELNEIRNQEGKFGEVSFEIVDKVQYFQHKYYRGDVLPAICDAIGESDRGYMHIELKKRYLYRQASDLREVPARYRGRAIYNIFDGENLKGYIPSTADLKYDEMKQFIFQCEQFLVHEAGGGLDATAMSNRAMAYGDAELNLF